jgi:hypothetical protein
MPSESRNMPEQEQSIKARAHELYVESLRPETPKSVKPFPVVLRETPAVPLSAPTKTLLWIVGIIVVLMFLAALWRVSSRHGLRHQTRAAAPTAKTAMLHVPCELPDRGSRGS